MSAALATSARSMGDALVIRIRPSDDVVIARQQLVGGSASIDAMVERIFRLMLETASGKQTKSKVHGYGQNEFVPWSLGAVM